MFCERIERGLKCGEEPQRLSAMHLSALVGGGRLTLDLQAVRAKVSDKEIVSTPSKHLRESNFVTALGEVGGHGELELKRAQILRIIERPLHSPHDLTALFRA